METKIGIYQIKRDGTVLYIGQSRNIKNRWLQHKYELKRNKHCNTYLQ